jgi:hypothetical protein
MGVEIWSAKAEKNKDQHAGEDGIDDGWKIFHGNLLLCKKVSCSTSYSRSVSGMCQVAGS